MSFQDLFRILLDSEWEGTLDVSDVIKIKEVLLDPNGQTILYEVTWNVLSIRYRRGIDYQGGSSTADCMWADKLKSSLDKTEFLVFLFQFLHNWF